MNEAKYRGALESCIETIQILQEDNNTSVGDESLLQACEALAQPTEAVELTDSVEKLCELARGLELPATAIAVLNAQQLFAMGQAIANQAKRSQS